jgi:hypothetical protein
MTIKLFRNIVRIAIAVDLTWLITGMILIKSLPPGLVAYVDTDMAARRSEGWQFFLYSSLEMFLVVCWFANLIGIYRLRPRSRTRYLIIQGILFCLELFGGPCVVNPLVQALSDLGEFGHGLLLALMFWSPVAEHFSASPTELTSNS